MLRLIDRNPWSVPVGASVVTAVLVMLAHPILGVAASFTSGSLRQQVYGSLTGSSSSLLGFLIAAVTILAAFGKRPTQSAQDQRREEALARARTKLVMLLLTAAVFMLIILVAASLALAASNSPDRLYFADALIVSSAAGAVTGLLYGSIGLGLAVAERAR